MSEGNAFGYVSMNIRSKGLVDSVIGRLERALLRTEAIWQCLQNASPSDASTFTSAHILLESPVKIALIERQPKRSCSKFASMCEWNVCFLCTLLIDVEVGAVSIASAVS